MIQHLLSCLSSWLVVNFTSLELKGTIASSERYTPESREAAAWRIRVWRSLAARFRRCSLCLSVPMKRVILSQAALRSCAPVYRSPKVLASLVSSLMLTGLLSAGMGWLSLSPAIAAHIFVGANKSNDDLFVEVVPVQAPVFEAPVQPGRQTRFPTAIGNTLRRDLSQRLGVPVGRLEVVEASVQEWSNGCLELAGPDEFCTQAIVEGWRVVLADGQQRWVYHTDASGQNYRLATPLPSKNSTNPTSLPPATVRSAIGRDLSRRLGLSQTQINRQIKIVEASQRQWANGCLELARPNEGCTRGVVWGWRVVLSNGQQRWVYHTDDRGDRIRLATNRGSDENSVTQLPQASRRAVLRAAAQYTGLATSQLRIVQAQSLTTDACLNLPARNESCAEIAIRAWEVGVDAGSQRLIYRTNDAGSIVRLASTGGNDDRTPEANRIPTRELPPALRSGTLFRTISSGGFAGRTYQTLLLEDGRLIRVEMTASSIPSTPQVRQLSRSQVREFQQLLTQQPLGKFDRFDYPATPGSADFITVTLSSPAGTVRYADSVQHQLPASLKP